MRCEPPACRKRLVSQSYCGFAQRVHLWHQTPRLAQGECL